uniref:proline-rich protein 12-like n=1 Tax=Gasterosteus aculeatus aculeatus TaxID=481459 RepID=UPI001A993B3A|nr:proline-rich protein 12-like [Gasterosteus aculeatus aculeatus]
MARTDIQLFELNHRTLTQWFSRKQRGLVSAVLQQGAAVIPAGVAAEPLLPVKGLSFVQVGQGQPFQYDVPDEKPGPSSGGLPPAPPPPPDGEQPGPSAPPDEERPGPSSSGLPPLPLGVFPGPAGPPPQLPRECRTTVWRKRKAAEAAAAAGQVLPPKNPRQQYTCSKCGQPKKLESGHNRLYGVAYSAAVGGNTVEKWREEAAGHVARARGRRLQDTWSWALGRRPNPCQNRSLKSRIPDGPQNTKGRVEEEHGMGGRGP